MKTERDNREEKEYLSGTEVVDSHENGTELHTEADLSERDEVEHHHDEETEQINYNNFTKTQFVDLIKELEVEDNLKKVDFTIRNIKPIFDELCERERTTALNRFILDGGSADDFDFKGDDLTHQFEIALKQIKDRKSQFIRGKEDQKNENLRKKTDLLERLRELVDSQDGGNHFDDFKKIQREWSTTGSVPGTQARSLWANYHALVDRFYDTQSIYFELKELDRKKNLEAKTELCIRAEHLSTVEKIKDAIYQLNELHHEFKHIGPVPADDKENVWQRFKAASDAVYARRDEFLKTLHQELSANLELKEKLCEDVAQFTSFQSDRIKEWNAKTKEVLGLQKNWETIGGVPRTKSKEVNKKFWTSFKTFFSNKSVFFKKLDEERSQNLTKKNELVQRALVLKESTEWDKTSNEFKELQQMWKNIGPVPEKFREKIYKEFKESCDYFFEQRRNQHGKEEGDQIENLKAKEAICMELERHITALSASPDLLKNLEQQFNDIGFVPRKDINTIRNRYQAAVEKFTNSIKGISEEEKGRLLMENQLLDLKNDPMSGQKIYHKEQTIRKKIAKVEGDIAVWKNNLEFFGRSKNADKYKEEFNEKINESAENLRQLKQQLKLLRTVS